jgi:microcystin-dependent protein
MPITAGQPIKASEVNAMFDTKENASNKVTTMSSASTDTQYPSAAAVYTALSAKANSSDMTTALAAKQNKIAGTANNIVAYSDAAGTLNTLTRVTGVRAAADALDTAIPTEKAVATALAAKANSSDMTTALAAKANASDVTALQTTVNGLQEKLPVGTILMYDGANWKDDETLVGWYQCNTANKNAGRTPDLSDRFIMGSSATGQSKEGGSNSVTIGAANLPNHTHTFTGTEQTGVLKEVLFDNRFYAASGVFAKTDGEDNVAASYDGQVQGVNISFSMTPSGTVTGGGSAAPTALENRPGYYAVIFIKKVS